MPACPFVTDHPTASRHRPVVVAAPAPLTRPRPYWPVLAMIGGLAVLVAAATVVPRAVRSAGRARPAAATTVAAATAPVDPLAITLSARDVAVVSQVYAPGQQSGWHAHTGIHAVAVLSGTLTVYDAQCRAETFGPGRPYVGGQEPHLVRNDTDQPVVMSVTYLTPSTHTDSTRQSAPPAGCPVG